MNTKIEISKNYDGYALDVFGINNNDFIPQDDYIGGAAWTYENRIKIYNWDRPEKNIAAYYASLHELGHISYKHVHNHDNTLINETEAWEWAFERAIRPMDEITIKAFNEVWFGSYMNNSGLILCTRNRIYKRFVKRIRKEGILYV